MVDFEEMVNKLREELGDGFVYNYGIRFVCGTEYLVEKFGAEKIDGDAEGTFKKSGIILDEKHILQSDNGR